MQADPLTASGDWAVVVCSWCVGGGAKEEGTVQE